MTGSAVELEIILGNWEMWEVLGKMLENGNGSLAEPDLARLDVASSPGGSERILELSFF